MRILYYDCFAGISGDMNLGALIDLGVDAGYLTNELAKLPIHGYELKIEKDKRKGISGTRVQVLIDKDHMHLSGDHHHHAGHAEHSHEHRSYRQIKDILVKSQLDENVRTLSLSIFSKIAEAEAKIHNMPLDDVHFHEVGAIDSIVDIVGAALCINFLRPDEIIGSTVELGGGTVKCAHGTYPVPAPATSEILKNIPVRKGTVDFEATTPTGAAILAACVNRFTDRGDFTILKTGYGIGSKDASIPNVLRVFLCSTVNGETETVPSFIIECNIDDMNPEFYDYIIDSLFAAGAKDVFITPVIMKKSRPAVKLSVLCTPDAEYRVNEVLFTETSTLGVRKFTIEKTMLDRKIEQVTTKFGDVNVKSAFFKGVCVKSKPEYEDCIKIARAKGIPVSQVYREVEKELARKLDSQ